MKTDILHGFLWGFFLNHVYNNRTELHYTMQTHTSYPTTRNSGELIERSIQSVVLTTLNSSGGVLLMWLIC